jgi:acyl-CoA thioester hydrolase
LPEVFEITIPVLPADIDEIGHVNNVIYLRWVQDVATAHWMARAPAEARENMLWVVMRHEIDYKMAARLGDEIIARTWVGPATRLRFERNTEFLRASDRRVLARALTMWCPMDARTLRPVPVSAEVREVFSIPAAEPAHVAAQRQTQTAE